MSNTITIQEFGYGELVADLTGKKIRGNQGTYTIDRRIARGTRSNLYRVIWNEREKYACAKILTFQMSDQDIKQMHREETVLSRMNHPNIIRVYDAIALENPVKVKREKEIRSSGDFGGRQAGGAAPAYLAS